MSTTFGDLVRKTADGDIENLADKGYFILFLSQLAAAGNAYAEDLDPIKLARAVLAVLDGECPPGAYDDTLNYDDDLDTDLKIGNEDPVGDMCTRDSERDYLEEVKRVDG